MIGMGGVEHKLEEVCVLLEGLSAQLDSLARLLQILVELERGDVVFEAEDASEALAA